MSAIIGTVVNKSIDLLTVELHIPGYQYCGPGTKLTKRLQRGYPGFNKLDAACKHDIIYLKYSDSEHRAKADEQLANRAWGRVKSNDASLAEKATAWTAKSKFGRSLKKKKKLIAKSIWNYLTGCGKGLYLKPYKKQEELKKKKQEKRRRRK